MQVGLAAWSSRDKDVAPAPNRGVGATSIGAAFAGGAGDSGFGKLHSTIIFQGLKPNFLKHLWHE
jgi:hypothetical protein